MSVVAVSPPKSIAAEHLIPGVGLDRTPAGWHASQAQVTLSANAPLAPGWYRFRLRIRSHDKFALHKRVELSFHPSEPPEKPVAQDSLHWNSRLDSNFLVELPRATAGLTLKFIHAEGGFSIEHFSVTRIPDPLVGLTAVGEKFKLVTAYRCLGPVLRRGGGLLLRGKFVEIGRKLLNGSARQPDHAARSVSGR